MIGRLRGSASVLNAAVCSPRAGIASAMRTPADKTTETTGRASTRSRIQPQAPLAPRAWRLSRHLARKGTRPFSTRSPSQLSTAGTTVTEPSIAAATTRIVPVAKPENTLEPVKYIPAMATMTVRPETSTARPEVADAVRSASAELRPSTRSSRSRRRMNNV